MKKLVIATLGLMGAWQVFVRADNRIVMYIKHAPPEIMQAAEQEAQAQSLATKLKDAETKVTSSQPMPSFSLKRYMTPSLGGVTALYSGYRDISDPDGLISFPLRHATPKVYIAITPQIKPINVKGNTYSHCEYIVSKDNPVQMYSLERKQDEKSLWFWDVKAVPVPEDKVVNPLTIVILANPQNCYLPQEQIWSPDNQQLVLPDLYIVNGIDPEIHMRFMDIEYLFEPIMVEQKKVSDTSAQQLITNI